MNANQRKMFPAFHLRLTDALASWTAAASKARRRLRTQQTDACTGLLKSGVAATAVRNDKRIQMLPSKLNPIE
jgi:hypothetical protein